MKKFNINHHIYIQITEKGWYHLHKTVGDAYIKNCIKRDYRVMINGEEWYRLQAHEVFSLFPETMIGDILYNPTIMFDDHELETV